MTKSSEEVAKTFGTLFADASFRLALYTATNEEQFKDVLMNRAQSLANQTKSMTKRGSIFDKSPKLKVRLFIKQNKENNSFNCLTKQLT